MRLVGVLKTHHEAVLIQRFFKSKKLNVFVDSAKDKQEPIYQIWCVDEDDFDKVENLMYEFLQDPKNPKFFVEKSIEEPLEEEGEDKGEDQDLGEADFKIEKDNTRFKKPILTYLWILFSCVIFFIQINQEVQLVKKYGTVAIDLSYTPIEKAFLFEIPQGFTELFEFVQEKGIKDAKDLNNLSEADKQTFQNLQKTAYFHGYLDALEDPEYEKALKDKQFSIFQELKKGELYRLFTPAFLHGSVLHILFNLIWIFTLMKQVEQKLGIFKTLILSLVIAAISNTVQYLISGPFFLGASGVVIGLACFIFAREKKAPWEGYTLSRMLIFFILAYVLLLVALSIGVFVFNLTSTKDFTFGIANTAHVVGGLIGFILGYLNVFRRKV
jgi:GlpG protein